MPRFSLMAFTLVAACGGEPVAPRAVTIASTPPRPDAAPSIDAAASAVDAVTSAVCGDRKPCSVAQVSDAGSASGLTLRVVKVLVGEHLVGEPSEYWLVTGEGAAHVQKLAIITGAEREEDHVTVAPNRLRWVRSGPTLLPGIFEAETEIELEPLRVLTEKNTFGLVYADIGSWSGSWDWSRFAGEESWARRDCDTKDLPTQSGRGSLTPGVELDASFTQGGWKTTTLGSCSVSFGPARAVVSDGAIFLDAPEGVAGSSFEVTVSPTGAGTYSAACLDRKTRLPKLVFNVASGAPTPVGWRDKLPSLERATSGGVVHVKLGLDVTFGVTFAYVAGGTRATTFETKDRHAVAGSVYSMSTAQDGVACAVRGGKLEPAIDAPKVKSDQPFIDRSGWGIARSQAVP